MTSLKLWGSRGGFRGGYVEINTGQESTLAIGFAVALPLVLWAKSVAQRRGKRIAVVAVAPQSTGAQGVLAYVSSIVGVASLFTTPPSLVPLMVSGSTILALHGLLRFLRRRGDDFFIYFRREPPGSSREVTYELKYRFKTVLTGTFGPELLRIDSYWQQLYPAGGGNIYRILFRPDPPATMVHERNAEGITLFESREPKECLEQAVELLKVLKFDPAEIEARIQEVVAVPPGPTRAAPPPAEGADGDAR
jgi:hypothetical protein